MQSVKVLLVLLALSQVECAPPSIWPAHRFSPPASWPFKQPSNPSPLFFSTHFPGSPSAPSEVSLPAEVVVSEPVVETVNPVIAEVIPVESALPIEAVVIPKEPALLAESIVPEVVIVPDEQALLMETILSEVLEVESLPQLPEPVISTSENAMLIQEVTASPVTDFPVEASTTTTTAPPSFQDTDTFKAYQQFINTWLTTASITLNRPDLLNMVTHTKPKTINTGKLPVKQPVEKSNDKFVEKAVEQVTVSETFEAKKVSGLPKKTPATVLSVSTTQSPIVDIPVTDAKPVAITKPVPSPDAVVPSDTLETTIVTSEPTAKSLLFEIVAKPELIVVEPIQENFPVQEQALTVVSETVPEIPLVQEQVITEVELIEVPSPPMQHVTVPELISVKPVHENLPVPKSVVAPELIVVEPILENLPIQDHSITEVDLVAEPSILQPAVVFQPAVEEFVLAPAPQLTESSYSKFAVSADGTDLVAPNPPATAQPSPVVVAPEPAQPHVISPVAVAPEPAQPRVIETFTPEGLTYTLQLFPKQGSSFFYSHTLGV